MSNRSGDHARRRAARAHVNDALAQLQQIGNGVLAGS